MINKRPEILSPAGNFEKMRAAILYGADAVYLAGEEFGMRTAATNFGEKDLKEGKEIVPNHYLPPHKNYNNIASRTGLKISKFIEIVVNKTLKRMIEYLSS